MPPCNHHRALNKRVLCSIPTLCSPAGTEVRFQDGYPLLLASEASLADLNARLGAKGPLPMNRFRPVGCRQQSLCLVAGRAAVC